MEEPIDLGWRKKAEELEDPMMYGGKCPITGCSEIHIITESSMSNKVAKELIDIYKEQGGIKNPAMFGVAVNEASKRIIVAVSSKESGNSSNFEKAAAILKKRYQVYKFQIIQDPIKIDNLSSSLYTENDKETLKRLADKGEEKANSVNCASSKLAMQFKKGEVWNMTEWGYKSKGYPINSAASSCGQRSAGGYKERGCKAFLAGILHKSSRKELSPKSLEELKAREFRASQNEDKYDHEKDVAQMAKKAEEVEKESSILLTKVQKEHEQKEAEEKQRKQEEKEAKDREKEEKIKQRENNKDPEKFTYNQFKNAIKNAESHGEIKTVKGEKSVVFKHGSMQKEYYIPLEKKSSEFDEGVNVKFKLGKSTSKTNDYEIISINKKKLTIEMKASGKSYEPPFKKDDPDPGSVSVSVIPPSSAVSSYKKEVLLQNVPFSKDSATFIKQTKELLNNENLDKKRLPELKKLVSERVAHDWENVELIKLSQEISKHIPQLDPSPIKLVQNQKEYTSPTMSH